MYTVTLKSINYKNITAPLKYNTQTKRFISEFYVLGKKIFISERNRQKAEHEIIREINHRLDLKERRLI